MTQAIINRPKQVKFHLWSTESFNFTFGLTENRTRNKTMETELKLKFNGKCLKSWKGLRFIQVVSTTRLKSIQSFWPEKYSSGKIM